MILPLLLRVVNHCNGAQGRRESVEGKSVDSFPFQFVEPQRIDGVKQIHRTPDASCAPAYALTSEGNAPASKALLEEQAIDKVEELELRLIHR